MIETAVAINPVIGHPMLSRGNEVTNRTNLLRRMSPELARTGPLAMSAVRSLSEVNRTWRGHRQNDANDPSATWTGAKSRSAAVSSVCYPFFGSAGEKP